MARPLTAVLGVSLGLASCVHAPETSAEWRAVEEYLAAQPGYCVHFPLDGNSARLGYRPSGAAVPRTWYEGNNPEPVTTADREARLKALTELGLLVRDPDRDGLDLLGYAVSEAGGPFAAPRGFCYGRYELLRVTVLKDIQLGACAAPPTKVVEYEYKLQGIPEWARSEVFLTAYPGASRGFVQTARASLNKVGRGWIYNDGMGNPVCVPRK